MNSFKIASFCRNLVKKILILLVLLFCVIFIILVTYFFKIFLINNSNIENPMFTNGELKIVMIDVGQGDSFLLLQNNKAMLIDSGKFDMNNEAVKTLKEYGVQKLDYAILTHPHLDHTGGFFEIMFNYKIEHFITTNISVSGISEENVFFYFWNGILKLNNVITNNTSYAKIDGEFQNFKFSDSEVNFLAPIDDYYEKFNNYSLVIKISYKDFDILFTADMEREVEEQLLDLGINVSSDVYKAAHHGSNTSNTTEFMNEVAPKYVLISSNYADFGHPVRKFVSYLEENNILTYRTDEQGNVIMVTDGKNIEFNTEPGDYKYGIQLLREANNLSIE